MIKDSKEHLISANETYVQHFRLASIIGLTMILGGFQALVHALCPGILRTSASNKIKDLHSKISDRA
tara:strand:- start:1369 stop:1569 length:201 start_codon:yes stop_codon:yes gene_type:complete